MRWRVLFTFVGFAVLVVSSARVQHSLSFQGQSTVTVRFRVVDDLVREALPGVRVTVTDGRNTQPIVQNSDSLGQVVVPGLASGRYRIDLEKAGYFPESYSDILISELRDINLDRIVITAKRSMSGIVRLDGGKPKPGVVVQLLTFRGGSLSRILRGRSVTTNDRGEFRFEELPARRYVVVAHQPATSGKVILPTFYPAASNPEAAISIDLLNNREVQNAGITVREREGVELGGTIAATTLPDGTVTKVALFTTDATPMLIASTETQVGKKFRLGPVPSGSYLLVAVSTLHTLVTPDGQVITPRQTLPPNAPPPPPLPPGFVPEGEGRSPTIPLPIGPPRPRTEMELTLKSVSKTGIFALPITVSQNRPVPELSLLVPDSATIEGVIAVERGQDRGTVSLIPLERQLVSFDSLRLADYGVTDTFPSNAKGEFRLTGALPGESYVLAPNMQYPPNTYIARLSQGTKDLLATGLPVVAGEGTVRLIVKEDGGTVEGQVKEQGRIPLRAFVVLAPKNRRVSQWYRTIYTRSDGTFRLSNVPPGDYNLLAFDRNDDDSYYGEAFLQKYIGRSKPIQIQSNSRSSNIGLELINSRGN